jgi:hypothetical protein
MTTTCSDALLLYIHGTISNIQTNVQNAKNKQKLQLAYTTAHQNLINYQNDIDFIYNTLIVGFRYAGGQVRPWNDLNTGKMVITGYYTLIKNIYNTLNNYTYKALNKNSSLFVSLLSALNPDGPGFLGSSSNIKNYLKFIIDNSDATLDPASSGSFYHNWILYAPNGSTNFMIKTCHYGGSSADFCNVSAPEEVKACCAVDDNQGLYGLFPSKDCNCNQAFMSGNQQFNTAVYTNFNNNNMYSGITNNPWILKSSYSDQINEPDYLNIFRKFFDTVLFLPQSVTTGNYRNFQFYDVTFQQINDSALQALNSFKDAALINVPNINCCQDIQFQNISATNIAIDNVSNTCTVNYNTGSSTNTSTNRPASSLRYK